MKEEKVTSWTRHILQLFRLLGEDVVKSCCKNWNIDDGEDITTAAAPALVRIDGAAFSLGFRCCF